ncbi:hypothetical protein BP5796_07019 [Coleophoma crateriformis]|uniref:Carrier domain-containing protein n=1 Tax=Coleophoma crateriformis TaxID=565419 RepID=A0A3D8RQH3_9HELO|nr:hypothetical protein BP5796_07019 [Coleophoma crateriformis]
MPHRVEQRSEPIAIVGSACRFPGGASSPSKLWGLLKEPRDLLKDISSSRFNPDGFYHVNGEHHGSTNVRSAYLLEEDHRLFDSGFFNVNPREADALDPQQRLLLETVYESIETAGFSIEALQGSNTSVWVGSMTADYYDIQLRDIDTTPQYLATGTARSILSNRVSYFFNWKGPSMTLDTACSSSLVAVHHAVQSLRSGESSIAIAAGVNLILGPEMYIFESKLHMLSPTGRSRMWDASADGYARGEGFAALTLKTLRQAIADGDHIECVIRETGVNQDGRTKGITMPSAESQAALIRSTYIKAGLDPLKESDRCQYFEAHGTGTPAGDPIEAEAVKRAFFPDDVSCGEHDKLFIGSVKTVIGHLEGTAGLAGVLKASLAIQHRTIPPNMHFHRLNPAIKPYYENLNVPTVPYEWPAVPGGGPRRASVNSFGFGGTNAHAILESWEPDVERELVDENPTDTPIMPVGPLTLSANSQKALLSTVARMHEFLNSNKPIDLSSLAWTIQTRRGNFQFRTAVSASTREDLCLKLDALTKQAEIGTRPVMITPDLPARIIGIFTGQGAQWASMGRNLILGSKLFSDTIETLEKSLAELPDGPSWSLTEELLAPELKSRLGEALLSQPLCTAVQIALINLLREANIYFDAVVGHSSGEIAAAYASGILTASHAIRIAYYRGVHAKLARSKSGHSGAMLAVGISYDEALKFCEQQSFVDRLSVAASNAPSSVTLSGDADAIEEAKDQFDQQGVFARLLKVDTAYHSQHMSYCIEPYLRSLRDCGIKASQPQSNCTWYSSVLGPQGDPEDMELSLEDTYWAANMTNAVLFSQAMERAILDQGCFDVGIEVGPHPALQAPVTQIFKHLTGTSLPYHGTLKRGDNDLVALSDTLGFIWAQFSAPVVDFNSYRVACCGYDAPRPYVLKDLPSYTWEHEQIFWKESRLSKNYRTRTSPMHELLGARVPSDTNDDMRWRNILSLKELPWLRGHQFQGQALFPAAGYVAMAIEAALSLSDDKSIKLVELQDVVIHRPITLEENSNGSEVLFNMRRLTSSEHNVVGEFACYAGGADEKSSLPERIFTGKVIVVTSGEARDILPQRLPPKLPMNDVQLDSFYGALSNIGLDYSGLFLVSSLKRRLGIATATVARPKDTSLLVHPAHLDAAFHAIFAAFCAPGDSRFWTHYLPTSINRVRIDVGLCRATRGLDIAATVDAYLGKANTKVITGDIEISGDHGQMEICVHGFSCSSFTNPKPADDRRLFSNTIWKTDISSGTPRPNEDMCDAIEDIRLVDICERACYYYLRKLRLEVTSEEVPKLEWYFQSFFEMIDDLLFKISSGSHPTIKKEWVADTGDMIATWGREYQGQIDLEIIIAVGENLASIVRGETPILQVMMENDMLNRLYKFGLGFKYANGLLSRSAAQIAHRYPRMKILEVGAGTGGATWKLLETIGGAFSSYTYTDISAGFFEKARELFPDYSSRMIFKTLNVEKDPTDQGYVEGTYDLVIASNVLHATRFMKNTMTNVRKLLKPGGHLLLLEVTSDLLRPRFVMSGLPGWWLGQQDGRKFHPTMTPTQWNTVLRETGFSGVDSVNNDFHHPTKYLTSIMVSQALDDRVKLLRQPVMAMERIPKVNQLTIIGGSTLPTSKVVQDVTDLLLSWHSRPVKITSLEEVDETLLAPGSAVLCLCELDNPFFKSMTAAGLRGIQSVFGQAKNVLWVTHGSRSDNPYSNMLVGVARSVLLESPHIRLQFLDIQSAKKDSVNAHLLASSLLRLIAMDIPDIGENILWTTEHELAIENEKLLIPRIIPNKTLNDRLNSEKRGITKNVYLGQTNVEIEMTDHLRRTRLLSDVSKMHPAESGRVRVRVRFSSFSPIKTPEKTELYLCLGSESVTNKTVITLAETNSSIVDVVSHMVFPCSVPSDQEPSYLASLLDSLFLQSAVQGISGRGTIWIHEPEDSFSQAASTLAALWNCKVFMTSESDTKVLCTQLHPYASARSIRAIVPPDVSLFLDMTQHVSKPIGSLLQECLPIACKVYKLQDILTLETSLAILHDRLAAASAWELKEVLGPQPPDCSNIISVETISGKMPCQSYSSIINWNQETAIPITICPIDAKTLFKPDKTYLLVGLTGELGQSLCDWMVRSGARYIVATSRNPHIDQEWITQINRNGGLFKNFAMDITDKAALHKVYEEICNTMPPIIGVANAAMVLRDKPFSAMTYQDMNDVLRPKVEGTKNLDALFADTKLDFFILFSSLACIIGNRGQSNYGAANMFMTSFVNQRRGRGLAASIIDIGMLLGIGYVARTGASTMNRLRTYNYMAIAETEMHEIFAEAIVAGRPESGEIPEIITSLSDTSIGVSEDIKPPWYKDPRFSHYILEESDSVRDAETRVVLHSVERQLLDATDDTDAAAILERCFATKLELILQLPSDSVNRSAPLVDLGIDSLIAVEIRSWFLKELTIDMPVLKVLGGGSIVDLCKDVMSRRPLKTKDTIVQITEASASSATERSVDGGISPGASSDITGISSPNSEFGDSVLEPKANSSRIIFQRTAEMSYAEARLWFLHVYLQDPSTCNVTFRGEIKGALQPQQLNAAIQAIAQKHSILRTCFFQDETATRPSQGIMATHSTSFKHKQVTTEDEVIQEMDRVKNHAYDIQSGESMQIILLSHSASFHSIIIGYHHIIMDGVSWLLYLQDLNSAYSLKVLEPLSHEYIDFSVKQRDAVERGELETEVEFWKSEYPDIPEPLSLFPFSRVSKRSPLKEYDTHTFDIKIDARVVAQIKKVSSRLRITTFHFYLSALQFLLGRFVDNRDIVVGIMDANRNEEDSLDVIGFFLNLLPIRFRMDHQQSFEDVARNTRKKVFTALAHSRIPFDVLIDELSVPRSPEHSPLFQVAMNYRMGYGYHTPLGACDIEWIASAPARNPYDLLVDITEAKEGICLLSFTTQKYLYLPEDVNRLMDSYVSLLQLLVEDPSVTLQQLAKSGDGNKKGSIERGHGPRIDFKWQPTLSHRIDHIIDTYPEHIAVKDGPGVRLTYKQVAARTNEIVYALNQASIPAGSKVAVYLKPCADSVCVLLAIMRVGAVYIPLDLRNPVSRLTAIVKDCMPAVIICHDATTGGVQHLGVQDALVINTSVLEVSKVQLPENLAQAAGTAFVLYTSGSTGTPKGISLQHSGFLNQIAGIQQTFNIGQEVVLQQSSLGFDMSLEQIFSALCNGGSVIIVPMEKRGDPAELALIMRQEGVTYTEFVPSEYSILLRHGATDLAHCSSWKFAFSGGEEITDRLKKDFENLNLPGLLLLNVYGPTEISLACTRGNIPYRHEKRDSDSDTGSVGSVLPNYSVYILDDNMQLVPGGYQGQICVGGAGVGLGYLNNDALTQERFVRDLFASQSDIEQGWTHMYLTGDRGRLLDDGRLIFQGRMDGNDQIKLRGIRIEPDEISNTILRASMSTIVEAVTTTRGDPAFLVAFVVFAPNTDSTGRDEYLRDLRISLPLPQYMLPAGIFAVDQIPINVNGKRDKFAIDKIPLPKTTNLDKALPLDKFELELKQVWTEVLGDSADLFVIDANSDFFSVGGNSLLLIKLQARVHEIFQVKIPLPDLFQASALKAMSFRIRSPLEAAIHDRAIDWVQETSFSRSNATLTSVQTTNDDDTKGKSILLTGATGFLGKAILQQLVDNPDVSEIHCVAVRASGQGKTRNLSVDSDKIRVYPGDLSEIRFGLSTEEFASLAGAIDVIVHNGADVSFMKTYHSFRGTNFESTKQLLDFALPRNIPFHFISSASVAVFTDYHSLPEISVANYPPAADGIYGYASSKWASERYLENAVEVVPSLRVCIHRPTSIVGEGAPSTDVMANLLEYSARIKCVPELEGLGGAFDFIPVGRVAQDIESAVLSSSKFQQGVSYVHHCSDIKVRPSSLQAYLEKEKGYKLGRVPMQEWIERSQSAGLSEVVTLYFKSVLLGKQSISLPVIHKGFY